MPTAEDSHFGLILSPSAYHGNDYSIPANVRYIALEKLLIPFN